jgi:iron complex transport system substrate-binding protein
MLLFEQNRLGSRFFLTCPDMIRSVLLFLLLMAAVACQESPKVDGKDSSGVEPADSIRYSKGFSIEYHRGYRIINVHADWQNQGNTPAFRYLLVPRGNPHPEGFPDAQVVETPVRSVICLSSLYVAYLSKLNLLPAMKGVDNYAYINDTAALRLIREGKVQEVRGSNTIDLEKVLTINPDLVITYGMGDPRYDSHPKLLEAGLKVAVTVDHLERSPLGRAEWLKFVAAFFDKEQLADSLFRGVEQRYRQLAELGRKAENKPTVFTAVKYGDGWYMPGGDSQMAELFADAGADYLWADSRNTGSLRLNYEEVFSRAVNADYWINTSDWGTERDLIANDSRNTEFKAYKNRNIYNNNARVNAQGGNDYWESGLLNPDVILADLIRIFHPGLLPEHELVYYRPLTFSPREP